MTTMRATCAELLRGPRWWVLPLTVYVASRIISTVITAVVLRWQKPNPFAKSPDFANFVSMWDGFWYARIAKTGYPDGIPSDAAGNAYQSEWAFFPVYPFMVRGVMQVTSLDFAPAGVLVNLILGAVLALVLFELFSRHVTKEQALVAVGLVFVFPASPVFQYTYTETSALLLLAISLRLLSGRHYWWAILPVVLLAFTRPIAVPFGLVVLVHLVWRWRRRSQEPLSVQDAGAIIVLGLTSAVSSVAFPLGVGIVNNEIGAYNRIQSAWHAGDLGYITPWWDAAERLAGPVFGALLLLLLVVAWLGSAYWGRQIMGVELTAWVVAYQAYLFVVLQPWSSVFRYWILLFPLALLAARSVSAVSHAVAWVWSMVSLQVVWVAWLWHLSPPSDIPP